MPSSEWSTTPPNSARPVIFGEVLFDRFPDGTNVLGGAPFNVAWHLQGFGLDPLLISRVGEDEAGRHILQSMQAWGMDIQGIQTDDSHPTGSVVVEFDQNGHRFSILPDQAYDHIDQSKMADTLASIPMALLYHGTLIRREARSREALDALLSQTRQSVFVDINLREPWWKESDLSQIFKQARWAKINDEELKVISRGLGYTGDLPQTARQLQQDFNLELLIVTLGAEGAIALHGGDMVDSTTPEKALAVVDTVGAGDAFSSVVLLGLLKKWTIQQTLHRAQIFASIICTRRGATVDDNSLYQELLQEWSAM